MQHMLLLTYVKERGKGVNMSINYAILGILSHKPLTGYELKKIMQESSFMYWSGNNNQIYKALVELDGEGYVTNRVYHQDSLPSKKVYTITTEGLEELKRWALSAPEAPEIKKAFLIQLAWTEQLSNNEIEILLAQYEQEIKWKILNEQEKRQKDYFMPNRTPRETAIWDLIYDNVLSAHTSELDWINQVRQTIHQFDNTEHEKNRSDLQIENTPIQEVKEMNYQITRRNNQRYIMLDTIGKLIQTEQDGLDIISICAENDTSYLLIQGERLSDDFLRLRTGLAGAILQKFTLYNIKVVVVLDKDKAKGKFKEFLAESNKGNMFRAYTNFEEAENWLLS